MIKLTFTDEDENEITLELPSKNEVCEECGGDGYVLAGGLRGCAMSSEEFYECFDEPEDREEYFRPGGKYDEVCDVCHGKNVVPVVDEGQLTPQQKKQYEAYCQWEEENARYEAESRAEREAERRMGC